MILMGKRFTSYILAQICFSLPPLNTKMYFCQLSTSTPHKRASKREDFKNQPERFCACPTQQAALWFFALVVTSLTSSRGVRSRRAVPLWPADGRAGRSAGRRRASTAAPDRTWGCLLSRSAAGPSEKPCLSAAWSGESAVSSRVSAENCSGTFVPFTRYMRLFAERGRGLTCVLVRAWVRWRCSGRWRWAATGGNPARPRSACSARIAFRMEGSWRWAHCGRWTEELKETWDLKKRTFNWEIKEGSKVEE